MFFFPLSLSLVRKPLPCPFFSDQTFSFEFQPPKPTPNPWSYGRCGAFWRQWSRLGSGNSSCKTITSLMGVPENRLFPQFMVFFHEEIRNMIINQWIWVPFLGQSRCLNFHIPATNPLFAGYLRCSDFHLPFWIGQPAVQVDVHRSLALSIFAMITGINKSWFLMFWTHGITVMV